MTVLGALARNLNDPTIPLTSTSLDGWWGASDKVLAGVSVTESRALGLTSYFRAITLGSSTMAALPWKTFKNGTRERVTQQTVLDNPNPAQTPFEFKQSLFANAMSWGNGFAMKFRDSTDVVRETWIVHPSKVRIEPCQPSTQYPDGKKFWVTSHDGSVVCLSSWDVFHMPYLSLYGTEGIRPLALAKQVLGINIAAEDTAARFYGKGSMISGILRAKDKLTTEQRKAWKQTWKDLVAGPQNAGEVAVLDNGGEFQPVALPPGDAQLLESRQFGVEEVSRLTGIPPNLLMMTGAVSNWGTGIEQQNIGLTQFTFNGWLTAADQRFTRELLPGGKSSPMWYVEADVNGLLRGDVQTRSAFYHQMRTDGVTTKNEIRAFENMEAVDGGDDFLLPAGVLPESIAIEVAKAQAVGAYVRAGFVPSAACEALGVPPIEHTGLVPVTVTVAEQMQPNGGTNAPSAA